MNKFSEKTRALYAHNPTCLECNSNQMCSIHHIFSTISNSPLNACLLCQKHHSKYDAYNRVTGIKGDKYRKKLLSLQIKFLVENNYKFTEHDKKFLKKINIDLKELFEL